MAAKTPVWRCYGVFSGMSSREVGDYVICLMLVKLWSGSLFPFREEVFIEATEPRFFLGIITTHSVEVLDRWIPTSQGRCGSTIDSEFSLPKKNLLLPVSHHNSVNEKYFKWCDFPNKRHMIFALSDGYIPLTFIMYFTNITLLYNYIKE